MSGFLGAMAKQKSIIIYKYKNIWFVFNSNEVVNLIVSQAKTDPTQTASDIFFLCCKLAKIIFVSESTTYKNNYVNKIKKSIENGK